MAADTITAIDKILAFESTLEYLKSPPSSYDGPSVDVLGQLGLISDSISSYSSYYAFETAIRNITDAANSGHFGFRGAVQSAVVYLRPFELALTSAVQPGAAGPSIFMYRDLLARGAFEASPVAQINDVDIITFLERESTYASFQDAEARYNSLFYEPQSAGSSINVFGGFCFPTHYPGPTTSVGRTLNFCPIWS